MPNRESALLRNIRVALQNNQLAEAATMARQLVSSADNNPRLLDMAGAVLNRCGDYQGAMTCYEKAIEQTPDNAGYYYNLAAVKRYLGDNAGSESALNRALAIDPSDYDAYHLRSDIRQQTTQDNHISALKSTVEAGISDWRGEMKICFALAKECEDIQDYDASFSWLTRACDLRRRHMSYRVENDLETIEEIIQAFTPQALGSATGGFPNTEAIFIVGLPRTGSTLVERILGSHDQVYAAGELNNFAQQMTATTHALAGRKLSRQELIRQSLRVNFSELGRAYLDSTRPVTGNTLRFTDKLPLNFLYCGLIHQALPDARIIHVTRKPMDACYAMYKRMFESAYPMSYKLEDLGKYYLGYRKLMRHWYRVLPGVIYPVAYEDLVDDQEGMSRGLIDHCGLDWQDACLRFEENTAPTTTASATQVRQAVYHSSVGKWRHYAKQLAPLQAILQGSGVDIETDAY